jgi:hypothetical protein
MSHGIRPRKKGAASFIHLARIVLFPIAHRHSNRLPTPRLHYRRWINIKREQVRIGAHPHRMPTSLFRPVSTASRSTSRPSYVYRNDVRVQPLPYPPLTHQPPEHRSFCYDIWQLHGSLAAGERTGGLVKRKKRYKQSQVPSIDRVASVPGSDDSNSNSGAPFEQYLILHETAP